MGGAAKYRARSFELAMDKKRRKKEVKMFQKQIKKFEEKLDSSRQRTGFLFGSGKN